MAVFSIRWAIVSVSDSPYLYCTNRFIQIRSCKCLKLINIAIDHLQNAHSFIFLCRSDAPCHSIVLHLFWYSSYSPPPFPILLCCTCCDTLVISVLLFNFVALDMMLPYRSSNDFVPIHQIQSKFCPLLYVQLWDLTFKNGHLTSHLMTELGKMKNLFKSSLAI